MAKSVKNSANTKKTNSVLVRNLTNQKQVLEIDGVVYVFNSYERKRVAMSKEDALSKFKLWVSKNIVII